jgi:hypothetical protein
MMADESRTVYKTRVTVHIGFSIEARGADGLSNWSKSGVSIETESGPGYPSQDEMQFMLSSQMADAVNGCNEEIGILAERIKSTK